MAVNKTSNRAERAKRLERVSALYLQKHTQSQIAEVLGVSQQQINYDLKKIRKQWLESAVRDFDTVKSQELAKIDEVETEYWKAWQDSREVIEPGDGPDKKETRKSGDPRFLTGVHRCVEKRCQLLGLDAPIRSELTGKDGLPLIPTGIDISYADPDPYEGA